MRLSALGFASPRLASLGYAPLAALAALAASPGCNFPDPTEGLPAPSQVRCKFDFIDVCGKTAAPARTFTTNTTLDTSNAATCTYVLPQPNGGAELCVIHAETLSISSNITVRALGSRPLALVSSSDLVINGILSVGSRAASATAAEELGAGALAGDPVFSQTPQSGIDGGGGGAGGTFGGRGGNGGRGNNDTRQAGSSPPALAAPTFLRGGCRGQAGADGTVITTGGVGGPPGGALLLAASGDLRLVLNARVAAGGGGGRGGTALAGAGGGGSGGMIVLEASKISNGGAVRAGGGGGGEGSQNAGTPTNGATGIDFTDDSVRADGAAATLSGGGGHGSSGASTNGEAAKFGTIGSGGGGGGGGAGFIVVRGDVTVNGVFSPPKT